MSLLSQITAAKTDIKASTAGPSQLISKTAVNMADAAEFELLANALEADGFKLHEAGMKSAGLAPTGEPMVALCVRKLVGGKSSTVTLYYNGTCVWAGMDPLDYKAAKAAKPRKP